MNKRNKSLTPGQRYAKEARKWRGSAKCSFTKNPLPAGEYDEQKRRYIAHHMKIKEMPVWPQYWPADQAMTEWAAGIGRDVPNRETSFEQWCDLKKEWQGLFQLPAAVIDAEAA